MIIQSKAGQINKPLILKWRSGAIELLDRQTFQERYGVPLCMTHIHSIGFQTVPSIGDAVVYCRDASPEEVDMLSPVDTQILKGIPSEAVLEDMIIRGQIKPHPTYKIINHEIVEDEEPVNGWRGEKSPSFRQPVVQMSIQAPVQTSVQTFVYIAIDQELDKRYSAPSPRGLEELLGANKDNISPFYRHLPVGKVYVAKRGRFRGWVFYKEEVPSE